MHLEALRLWSLLKKGSVFCAIFLLVSLTLEIQTYLAASATRDVAMVWSLPPEPDVAGYNVYYGPVSRYDNGFDEYLYEENLRPGDYDVQDPEVHYVLSNIDENLTYWVSITAYDNDGNESAYSNEKKIGVPDTAPPPTTYSAGGGGGCQTALSPSIPTFDRRAAAAGWIFFCLVVPAYIVRLRKRLS